MYVRADAPLTDQQKSALWLAIQDHEVGGQTKPTLLNLNSYSLINARKAAIDAEKARLSREFPGGLASRQDREARANDLAAGRVTVGFVSARIAYLLHEAGKNRPAGAP